MASGSRKDLHVLALIVLLGAGLRLYQLGDQSLWLDELFSLRVALAPTLRASIDEGAVKDMFPPLFPIISHFFVRLPFSTEVALRLPSALAGIVTVFVTFLLGRALSSARIGVIAAACMACHWFAVSYSQEGRPYSLLLLITLLTSLVAIQLVDAHRHGRSTRGLLLALGACGLVASYFHYIGLVFFLLVGAVLLVVSRRGMAPAGPVFFTYLAVGLAYLPWVPVVLAQIGRRVLDKEAPRWMTIKRTMVHLTAHHLALFALIVVAGLWASRRRDKHAAESSPGRYRPSKHALLVLLGVWIVLPIVSIFVFSHVVAPIYTQRNLIVALPAVVLLASWAADSVDRVYFRELPVLASALVLGLLLDLVVTKSTYSEATKEPFRSIAERIVQGTESISAAKVAVLAQPDWAGNYLDQYFEILHSDLRVSSEATNQAEALWIMTRGVDLIAPAECVAQELLRHEPDPRVPYPGQPMVLYRCGLGTKR